MSGAHWYRRTMYFFRSWRRAWSVVSAGKSVERGVGRIVPWLMCMGLAACANQQQSSVDPATSRADADMAIWRSSKKPYTSTDFLSSSTDPRELSFARFNQAVSRLREQPFIRITCAQRRLWIRTAGPDPGCDSSKWHYLVRAFHCYSLGGEFQVRQDRAGVLLVTYIAVGRGSTGITGLVVSTPIEITDLVLRE